MVSKPNLHSNTLCQSWLDSALPCPYSPACAQAAGADCPQPLCPRWEAAPWAGSKHSPCTEPAAHSLCGSTRVLSSAGGKDLRSSIVCYKIPAVSVSLFSSPAIFQEQLSTQIALSLGLKAKQTQLAHTAAPS